MNDRAYISSAASAAAASKYSSQIYFTLDESKDVNKTIKYLKTLALPNNIIHSTGSPVCAPRQVYNLISEAGEKTRQKVISQNIVWTIDNVNSYQRYYDLGARGFVTNDVKKCVEWAEKRGIRHATLDDIVQTKSSRLKKT